MPRVTAQQVKALVGNTDVADDVVDIFIGDANILVNELLANKGLSDGRLTSIERYLSAHFLASLERQVKTEKIGDTSRTYEGMTGTQLSSTHYGQYAAQLDTSGCLTNLGKTKATFRVF